MIMNKQGPMALDQDAVHADSIAARQNSDWSLLLLAAQRQVYSEAKRWRGLRAGAATIAALSGVIATAVAPDLLKLIGPVGALLGIVQVIAVAIEKRRTKIGATIQEQFDTSVYPLPWNALLGRKIDPEEIAAAAARHRGKRDSLVEWYSVPKGMPNPLAVLLCQRTNLRWDMALRGAYANAIMAGLIGLLVLIAIAGLARNLSLGESLLALLPSTAAFLLGIDNVRGHREHVATQITLKGQVEGTWDRALNSGSGIPDETELRAIQDSVFRLRSVAPPVPDRFYQRKRDELELGMRLASQRLWEEAQELARDKAVGSNQPGS